MSEVIAAGRVSALHRYPVKSMQGEQLPELQLTMRGADGDRVLALLDRAAGLVASAHHPAKWGQLLHCQARTTPDRKVWVTLPGGRELPAGAQLERELGAMLARDVGLISSAPAGGAYEIVHPDVPGTAPPQFVKLTMDLAGAQRQVGRLGLALEAEPGTLVDVAPIHLITSAALGALTAGSGDGDPRRYRPNIVLDLDAEGYAENEWAGCKIAVGDACLQGMFPLPAASSRRSPSTASPPASKPSKRSHETTGSQWDPAAGPALGCTPASAHPARSGSVPHSP